MHQNMSNLSKHKTSETCTQLKQVLPSYLPENLKTVKGGCFTCRVIRYLRKFGTRTWLTAFLQPPVPNKSHHQLSDMSAGTAST